MPNSDALAWLSQFNIDSPKQNGLRELRIAVYQQTLDVVKCGYYSADNQKVELPDRDVVSKTAFFDSEITLPLVFEKQGTQFSVIEADCIEVAHLLQKAGYKVGVLNMANRQTPGGGVIGGAGAQEENIFRRTNLFQSLYQFADFAPQYGIERHAKSYPLDRNFGGIYSGDVTVFRGSESNAYCLLPTPFVLNFITVAALNRPDTVQTPEGLRLSESMIEPIKNKIRTILRIGIQFGNDCLVLSAFGCGAFCNPPAHMAELFKEVFAEVEFSGRLKLVVFAIIDDHNAHRAHNPEGNVIPFMKVFNA